MTNTPPPDVAAVFAAFPSGPRTRLMAIRRLIFQTAASLPEVGPVEEALKWGEPAYLTPVSKSGSTIRLGWNPADPGRCALYFNCQTDLVETFRAAFADDFGFEGNRALTFPVRGGPPDEILRACIARALTYHAGKRGRRSSGRTIASGRVTG